MCWRGGVGESPHKYTVVPTPPPNDSQTNLHIFTQKFNALTPTVVIWVQL